MRGLTVSIRERKVTANHLHRGMTQETLEREHIAAIPEILDGKRVPEPVRVCVGDSCPG